MSSGAAAIVVSSAPPRSTAERDCESDWNLVARARSDARSFSVLFERHRDFVHRLAWGFAGEMAAEDITQEVFARLLQRRKPWVRRAKFSTVLYSITLNASREWRRRAARHAPEDDGAARLTREDQPADDSALLRRDLLRSLARLSARQREVVLLRHFEGLSTRETARVLRCSEGTVKTHLHRGLEALRQHLQ